MQISLHDVKLRHSVFPEPQIQLPSGRSQRPDGFFHPENLLDFVV
jgi:hypothetical protein